MRRSIDASESKHPAGERSLDGHDDESGCTEDKDAEADTGGYKAPPLHSGLASDEQYRPCAGCGNAREKQDYESSVYRAGFVGRAIRGVREALDGHDRSERACSCNDEKRNPARPYVHGRVIGCDDTGPERASLRCASVWE